jgi:hypothetical protein
MSSSKRKSLVVPLLLIVLNTLPCAAGNSVALTTTELSVSPRNVDIGSSVLMSAKVSVGTTAVQHGSVMFCDAKATRCEGSALFGSAQLTRNGTASIRLTLGAGSYSVKAVFAGTSRTTPPIARSSSAAQAFTVTVSAKAHQ